MNAKAGLFLGFVLLVGSFLFHCGDSDTSTNSTRDAHNLSDTDVGEVQDPRHDGSDAETTDAGENAGDDTSSSDRGLRDVESLDGGEDAFSDTGQDGATPDAIDDDVGTDTGTQDTGADGGTAIGKFGVIAGGRAHTCALTEAKGVECWGDNADGQLGDGTTNDSLVPRDVLGLPDSVAAVSTGSDHACALTFSNRIKCWGQNRHGELGNGNTSNETTPTDVIGFASDAEMVSAGLGSTCARQGADVLKCWGRNEHGQLGDGTTEDKSTPADVSGLPSRVRAVSAGGFFVCALTESGAALCWGGNASGQLGDGTLEDKPTPVGVFGLSSDVATIAAGVNNACAASTSGGAKCWGRNELGQLGAGTTQIDGRKPVDVFGLSDRVTMVTVGRNHACALTDSGGVKCWGDNTYGQLGDGSNEGKLAPTDVNGLTSEVAAISAGWEHTCALMKSGKLRCWGQNRFGQLGTGTQTNDSNPTPEDVVGFGP